MFSPANIFHAPLVVLVVLIRTVDVASRSGCLDLGGEDIISFTIGAGANSNLSGPVGLLKVGDGDSGKEGFRSRTTAAVGLTESVEQGDQADNGLKLKLAGASVEEAGK